MRLRITYYPDITQHRTPEQVRDAVVTFSEALAAQMSQVRQEEVTIEVLPVVTVAEQTAMIAEGRCEIALIKPSSYVLAHGRNPRVSPAAVALRVIDGVPGDRYFAQLYCHVDSGFRILDDVIERCRAQDPQARPSVGFGDPFSTANFLVPAARLAEVGLFPFTRFRRSEFFGGHDGVVRAVYARQVDVGAGHDGVIVDLARQPGYADAAEKLVRLDRVFIHSDPVAVLVDDLVRTQLTECMVAIASRPEIKQALDIFWGAVVGLAPTEHANYASVEQAIARLGIPENDLLV